MGKKAVFYQNGTWAYNDVKDLGDDNLGMLPIYIGPMVMPSVTICTFPDPDPTASSCSTRTWLLTAGEPANASEMLALNIYNTFLRPLRCAVEGHWSGSGSHHTS